MDKAIIILNGVAEGKNKFVNVAKMNNYWVWNLNHRNVLSLFAHKLGWNGERTQEYYEFIDEFAELVNKYFDFENWYIDMMINQFLNDEKSNLLIIHNCSEYLECKLQEEYSNCFSVGIFDGDLTEKTCVQCKTLNYRSDSYVDDILSTLDILTKDFNIQEET
jgi:hypothetical protein